jgi:DNA-binding NtrC family response regulator
VRELRNLIERSLILGALNVSALYQGYAPKALADAALTALPTDLHTLEKLHITAVLDSVGGDKTRAARLLGISRRTLERRVADWAAR